MVSAIVLFLIFRLSLMKASTLSSLVKNSQNQLFSRTRWRLATWYAGMMSIVVILSASGIYHALLYAYRLTIIQELDLVANDLHETLEPILEQPGELAPAASKILPDLCVINTKCLAADRSGLLSNKYYVRLFDHQSNLVAVVGRREQDSLNKDNSDKHNGITSLRQYVSVELETKDFQSWGFLEVGHSSSGYEVYTTNLRWIFIVGLPTLVAILILISWWLAGRAMQPVRQSYQLLQQFTADAAHELRTPLAAIRATVESTLMMSVITETDTKETLETIGRQNVRLSNLVADLLMLSRMDRQLNLTNLSEKIEEQVSLANLIKDIVEDFGSLALKLKIQLDIKLLVSEPLFVAGNYEQLYRMISNLVANALQYTEAAGKVNLTLNRYGKNAAIKIEDSGIGISSKELNKIFTRFYRVNSDRSRDTGGSGLGLSIAQAIAFTHQGTIKVESKLGQGSIFTILLPIDKRKII